MGPGPLPPADPDRRVTVGVAAALPGELAVLARCPPPGRVERRGALLVVVSGIGSRAAAAAGAALLAAGAGALLSWGCAAGLDPRLAAGTLLLPERVRGAGGGEWAVDAGWRRRLRTALGESLPVAGGLLAESPGLLTGPAAKAALARTSGARAADMESAALAALARRAGVPMLVVRAVVDPAGVALPRGLAAAIGADGRLRWLPLLAAPGAWPEVWRLARGWRAARTSLAAVARRAGRDFRCSG